MQERQTLGSAIDAALAETRRLHDAAMAFGMARAADALPATPEARFLARLEPGLAASFTPAQLGAIGLHFGMRHRADHAIDVRRGFRLFGRQFYFVFLAGAARRNGG
jgi:hypothetical protein